MRMARIEDFQKRIYGLYQLDWMQQHGWTILDMISSMQELILDNETIDSVDDIFFQVLQIFEDDYGFKGTSEIYDNEDEFFAEDGLYHEKEYILGLCSRIDGGMKLYEDYSNSMGITQKESVLDIVEFKYAMAE